MILAPSTLAIQLLDVFILNTSVTTTMHVPKITAPKENVFSNQLNLLLQKINAKFLHAIQRTDLTLILRIVMIAIHAPLIIATLGPDSANTKERIAMIKTNAQTISAMQQLELAHISLSFALITMLAPKILVMLLKDVSTLLNLIYLLFLNKINALYILAIFAQEIW
jgi:hypothetical protein